MFKQDRRDEKDQKSRVRQGNSRYWGLFVTELKRGATGLVKINAIW